MAQHATIRDGSVEDRTRRPRHVLPKLRVNAVGSYDDVAFGDGAIGERHTRAIASLLDAYAAMFGSYYALRQRGGQYLDEVSAVHPDNLAYIIYTSGSIGAPS